jgi:hypothetical protein
VTEENLPLRFRDGFSEANVEYAVDADSSLSSGIQRFDTNEEPGIQRDEVVNAIVAFNGDRTIGGEPVNRGDIVNLIIEHSS